MTFKERLKAFWTKIKDSRWAIFWSFAWIVPLLVALDQGTKWAVQLNLYEGQRVTVIENFLYITLTYNEGSAFGMGSGSTVMRVIFIIISWVMSGVLGYALWHYRGKNDKFLNFVLSLCLAGAIGNLIDRTFYFESIVGFSGVIDFVMVYLQGGPSGPNISYLSPFPIFNVADMCLTIGVILFIVWIIVGYVKDKKAEKKADLDDTSI